MGNDDIYIALFLVNKKLEIIKNMRLKIANNSILGCHCSLYVCTLPLRMNQFGLCIYTG